MINFTRPKIQEAHDLFGMGFVSNSQIDQCDSLFGNTFSGGIFSEGPNQGTFLNMKPEDLLIKKLGMTTFNGAEVSGTGDGRVFLVSELDMLHNDALDEPEAVALAEALLAPLREGHDMGLLSEAGMPAVADPASTLQLVALNSQFEALAERDDAVGLGVHHHPLPEHAAAGDLPGAGAGMGVGHRGRDPVHPRPLGCSAVGGQGRRRRGGEDPEPRLGPRAQAGCALRIDRSAAGEQQGGDKRGAGAMHGRILPRPPRPVHRLLARHRPCCRMGGLRATG